MNKQQQDRIVHILETSTEYQIKGAYYLKAGSYIEADCVGNTPHEPMDDFAGSRVTVAHDCFCSLGLIGRDSHDPDKDTAHNWINHTLTDTFGLSPRQKGDIAILNDSGKTFKEVAAVVKGWKPDE